MIFLAGIESLLPILIFAAFALFARWLKSKAQRESADDYRDLPRGPQPQSPRQRHRQPQPLAQTAPRSKSWEEQLRDLLEDRAVPPPVPREVLPPIIYAPAPPSPPPPVPQEAREPMLSPSTRLPHRQFQSSHRHEHASTLQQRIAQRFQEGAHRHGAVAFVHHAERSVTTRRAIQLVQTPDGLRTAMVASVILGPPKALEET